MQEMAELLTRGSAAASLRLLWQMHMLDVLLPSLAQRFKASKLPRCSPSSLACVGRRLSLPHETGCRLVAGSGVSGVWWGMVREPGRLGASAEMLFAVLEELDQWVSPQKPVSSSVLAACLAAPFVADAAAAMQACERLSAEPTLPVLLESLQVLLEAQST